MPDLWNHTNCPDPCLTYSCPKVLSLFIPHWEIKNFVSFIPYISSIIGKSNIYYLSLTHYPISIIHHSLSKIEKNHLFSYVQSSNNNYPKSSFEFQFAKCTTDLSTTEDMVKIWKFHNHYLYMLMKMMSFMILIMILIDSDVIWLAVWSIMWSI